jgi:hypothetical protein
MFVPLAPPLAVKIAPPVMLVAAGVLAFFQGDTGQTMPTDAAVNVVQLLITALAAGGTGTFLIKMAAGEYSKTRAEQRALVKEERALERADDERRYTDHKELTAQLLAAYNARIAGILNELALERQRSDKLLTQMLSKIVPADRDESA